MEVTNVSDLLTRDASFLAFVDIVISKAFADNQTDVVALMQGELESAREALVQKIGENISVRRVSVVEGGVVDGYVHSNNRIAVVTQLEGGNSELARDVSMHVAAVNPQVVKPEDMPAELVEKEQDIIKAQPDMAGKPAEIVEKMMQGRINKYLKENSLLEQPFVKNPELRERKHVCAL